MSFSFNKYCSDVLPAGKYKAIVTSAAFRMGGDGVATKDIVVKYTIAEGPFEKKVISDTIFQKAHSFRLRPFLQACGVDVSREFDSMDDMFQYGLKEAAGKTVIIDVTIRTYNGKEYNNVDNWSPLPGSTTSVADVLAEFGESPEVKANVAEAPVAKAVEEAPASNVPQPTAEASAEPNLSFDVVDGDLPF